MDTADIVDRPDHVPPERVADFDIYAPPGAEADFHLAWKTLHAPGLPDLLWTPRNGGHWIPTRAPVIAEVMSNFEVFSNRTIMIPKALGADHSLIPTTLDPPRHRPYRMILNDNLARPAIARVDSLVRDTARELIDQVIARGSCNFTSDYAEKLPIRIFMALMDLPLEAAPRTKYWCDQLLRPDGSMTFAEAMAQLFGFLAPHVEGRRGSSGTDMLSRMVNATVAGRPLTEEEAMKLTVQVLIAGLDTVVNFLGFAMLHLARNPEHQRALANDPALVPGAVEELLRRYPVVTIGREITRDIDFRGVRLKQGEMIAAPTALAGMDEREYEDAMTVDFARHFRRHLTFGTSHHLCPGRDLARLEIAVTLEEWTRRIPDFALAPHAEVSFTGGIVGVVDNLPLVWRTGGKR